MRNARASALFLAALLQLAPVCRVVTTQLMLPSATGNLALRWVVGAFALLGACHAVSGASTVITSPLTATGTNGVPFSYRITTGPQVANQFNAAPLPPGLAVSTTTGRITGTPTATGNWAVLLTASDSGIANRTVTATLSLTIVPSAATRPAITTQPASQTVNAGGSATFSVVATGTAPLAYQWRLGSAPLAGKTTATLSLTGVTTNQAGSYTVIVSNAAGSVTSAAAVLTVNTPLVAPSITAQPQNRTVVEGSTAAFSVSAAGTAPLSYQWLFGSSALAGQTSSTLSLVGVNASQAGSYSVVVANAAGSITSSPALLQVNIPPSITAQPQNQTVVAGATAAFSVAATGTAPLGYQWRFGSAALAGQTRSTLSLVGVTASQAGSYSVVVANAAGSITSSPAMLQVNVPPFISGQPQNFIATPGATAMFSVTAGGTSPLTYQWRFGVDPLPGQTASTLSLPGVTTNQAGSYSVVLANGFGSVTSAPALLTVNPLIVPPSITLQPQSDTVTAGGSASFTVLASGTAPLSYQWRFENSSLLGQTNPTLSLTSLSTNQAGDYSVVISNAAGSITSAVATLTVIPATPPAITAQPQPQSVTAGASATFSVSATGTAPLNYQWHFGATALTGETSSTLSLNNVTTNQAGAYRVVVANLAGSVTSAPALLTVNLPLVRPTIIQEPQSLVLLEGGNGTFVVEATGSSPLGYQWRFAGRDLPGETRSTLLLSHVTTNQAGEYTVVVSNPAGSAASSIAFLTVQPIDPGTPGPTNTAGQYAVGKYQGLISDVYGVALGSSGFFSLNVSRRGSYSASLLLTGGWKLSASGTFASDGTATNLISLRPNRTLVVTWALATDGSERVRGFLVHSNWTAELLGDRAGFSAKANPCPYEGNYTFVLPGIPESTNSPAGHSFGTVHVDRNGIAMVKGRLADKKTLAQKVPISKSGAWPLFAPLYSKLGAVLGWVQAEDRLMDDFHGSVCWLKPALPTEQYFPAGFSQWADLSAAAYAPSGAKNAALQDLGEAQAIFSGGNLPEPVIGAVHISPNGKIEAAGVEGLKISLQGASGLFTGSFKPNASSKPIAFQGALLQKGRYAAGFFLGQNQSGTLRLQPAISN